MKDLYCLDLVQTLDSSHKIRRRLVSLEDEDGRENFWRELGDAKTPPVLPSTREKLVCFLSLPSNLVSRASKSPIKSLVLIL